MGLFATIPGLQEVVEAENRVRDAALIGIHERIAGFDARPLNLEDYLALRLIRNPFIVGGEPSAEAIFEFLKRVAILPDRRTRRKLIKACRACRFPTRLPLLRTARAMKKWEAGIVATAERLGALTIAIKEYVDESTQDWPAGNADGGEEGSVYGLGVAYCAMIWREYRWPFERTLKTPLKVVLQCVKEIQFRQGRRAFRSPSKDFIGLWLNERNRTC